MNSVAKVLTATLALLLACVTSTALAKAKPNKNKARTPTARLEKKLASADLSPEAREKAKKAIDQNAAKLKEAQAKVDAVLSADQKQTLRKAQKDARTSGKKGRQAREEALAALKLTDEQKSKLKSAEAELKSALGSLNKDLQNALTKDDLAKLGIKARKKKA